MGDKRNVVETSNSIAEFEKAFAENPMGAHARLRRWKNEDHNDFLAKAVVILKRGEDNSFTHLILQMCREDGTTIQHILFTANILSLDEAARLVRLASKTDPAFQVHLVASVKAEIDKAGSSVRSEDLTRLMEMLVHAVDANRLVPFLAKLCEHGDERIRSKAVLLTGRVDRQLPEGVELLKDADARVRANAVEAMWSRKDPGSIKVFKEASKDPHHRVAANAIMGLYKAGEIAAVQQIGKMVTDTDVGRQLAGIWLIGQTKDPRFTNYIQSSLGLSTGRQKYALLKAGRMIKQRRDEVLSKAPLRLEAVRTERDDTGRVRVAFLGFAADGTMLMPDDIPATQAVVHDGEMRVDQFQWSAWGGVDGLHAAFLIPMRTGVSENFATQLVSAMELGISGKRKGDQWAIQKYELTGSSDENSLVPIEFSGTADLLRSEQLRSSRGAARGLAEGIERLIPVFPLDAARKHLVVLLDPDLDSQFEVPEIWSERCQRLDVILHVVACGKLSEDAYDAWRKLCFSRQGIFLECGHAAELPLLLRRLCLSLQSGFEITYQLGRILPSSGGAETVSIEVYSDLGHGKLTLGGDGQVIPNVGIAQAVVAEFQMPGMAATLPEASQVN